MDLSDFAPELDGGKQYVFDAGELDAFKKKAASLSKKKRRFQLIAQLRRHANLALPESKLCFAVIEQAVAETFAPKHDDEPDPEFFFDGRMGGFAEGCGLNPQWIVKQVAAARLTR